MLVLAVAGLAEASLYAQRFEAFGNYGDMTPSVNSFAMTKYGGLDPILNTGAMSLNIPLGEYQDLDFNIPISLGYHYDGYKPHEYSGEIGLGWSLFAGGVITRDVRGVPDENTSESETEAFGYYHTIANGIPTDDSFFLQNIKVDSGFVPDTYIRDCLVYDHGSLGGEPSPFNPMSDMMVYATNANWERYETLPDIFHFSVLGMSGDFCIFPDGTVRMFNSSMPHGEIEVEFIDVNNGAYSPHKYVTIRMMTGDGTKFYFGEDPSSTEYSESSIDDGSDPPTNEENLVITAIKLSRIVAPNGREVRFNYSAGYQSVPSSSSSRKSIVNEVHVHADSGLEYNETYYPLSTEYRSYQRHYYTLLESISVDGDDMVVLNYCGKARNEFANANLMNPIPENAFNCIFQSASPKCLSSITFINKDSETVSDISFNQSFAPNGTPKMFLSGLSVASGGEYSFRYNNSLQFPENDTNDYDYWGYWNDCGLSYTSIRPTSTSLYGQFSNASVKAPSLTKTIAGALTQITYPTGGYTEIEYEQNDADWLIDYSHLQEPRYIPNYIDFQIGGIRVKSLTDISGNDRFSKVYCYSDGWLNQMTDYFTQIRYKYRLHYGWISGDHDMCINVFSYGPPAGMLTGNHITYDNIVCTKGDGSKESVWYYSQSVLPNKDSYANDDNTVIHTKTVYMPSHDCYLWYDDDELGNIFGLCSVLVEDKSSIRNKMESVYSYDSDGKIKKSETYHYALVSVGSIGDQYYNNITNFYSIERNYYTPELTNVTVVEYFGTDSATNTMSYRYNSLGQKVSESVTAGACPNTLRTRFRYLHESDTTALRGLLSDVVRTRVENGTEKVVASEHYGYASPTVHGKPSCVTAYDIPAPAAVSDPTMFSAGRNGAYRQTRFSYDDSLRLAEVILPGGDSLHYEWDGSNLISRTQGGRSSGNTSRYDWKDLVGLTRTEAPSGISESYLYDEKNRLHIVKDMAESPTTKYEYGIKNEQ